MRYPSAQHWMMAAKARLFGERAADPTQWRGQNLLGFALIDVRARLRAG